MRRADRLFDIVQLLRRGGLMRAGDLAAELEVSKRTIYRDVAALIASGVPIEGEAGVGYVLKGGYDLPPLMFDVDEIESLVLGARIVSAWADAGLAQAADKVLGKIHDVLPDHLRLHMDEVAIDAPREHWFNPIAIDLQQVRLAVRDCRKIEIEYQSKAGEVTTRRVRPLLLSFYGAIWNLTTWCEVRRDFRTFRVDCILAARFLDEHFGREDGRNLEDLMARAPEDR